MNKITVPLRLLNLQDDGFHLLVEIVVFGEIKLAVVDTGASRTVFDKALIEEHRDEIVLHEDPHVEDHQATTLFSTSNAVLATLPLIKIGGLKLKKYTAVGLDLQSVNETYQQLGHPAIVAILGGDILLKYHAVLNYKKLRLKLYK
ncbi:aspartyl protease family protein [Pedobacter sp.]|uniref:aspartyl protease family protein n=1 Tax=Pedobacter sp. TaxID=1411316 RepID=UPI003D7FFA65